MLTKCNHPVPLEISNAARNCRAVGGFRARSQGQEEKGSRLSRIYNNQQESQKKSEIEPRLPFRVNGEERLKDKIYYS